MHVRGEAVWSDGVPVTAADVRFSWQAAKSKEVAWANAYTDLQDGLADCAQGIQVFVAAGTYVPDDCDPTCDRSTSFVLDDATCDLVGGFAGSGSTWDPEMYVTILSGDNAGNDPTVTERRSYH